MKKSNTLILLVVFFILSTSIVNAEELKLVQKDTTTWFEKVGASATLTYNSIGETFDYVLEGVGLDDKTEYSLIYYKDVKENPTTEPGIAVVIGTHTTDVESDELSVEGSADIGTIPQEDDANSEPSKTNGGNGGAKIWLVPNGDINKDNTLNWQYFGDYLFEENLRDENGNEIEGTSKLIVYVKGTPTKTFTVIPEPEPEIRTSGGASFVFGNGDISRYCFFKDQYNTNNNARALYFMNIIMWENGFYENQQNQYEAKYNIDCTDVATDMTDRIK